MTKHAPRPNQQSLTALIISGGKATRLHGIRKTALSVDGTPLIERALRAVRDTAPHCPALVVGDPAGLNDLGRVVALRENPPFSGPASAIATGVSHVRTELVAVLPADMPKVGAHTVRALIRALTRTCADSAVAVDEHGRTQYLTAVWRTRALRAAIAGAEVVHRPVRALYERCEWVPVLFDDASTADIDTPEDAARFGITLR